MFNLIKNIIRNHPGLFKATAFMLMFIFIRGSFVSKEMSTTMLETHGFEQVKINGFGWNTCQFGDVWSTKFTASINGTRVSGAVCESLISDAYIRYNSGSLTVNIK